jgi:hypothetical protein
VSGQQTVVFVCPHGAGKSRIAAAWFSGLGVPGWAATSAGVHPQTQVSIHAARLLADTPVRELLDDAMPRPISAVPQRDLLVAIDCPPDVDADVRWTLAHQEFNAAMCTEIRDRVHELGTSFPPERRQSDLP